MEHAQVLRQVSRWGCRTIIDIGANRGQFALAARTFIPRAELHAFEPLSEPANIFSRIFQGDSGVCLHCVAIGPRPHVGIMHVSARDDSSSLLEIAELQVRTFPGTNEVGTQEVPVTTLECALGNRIILEPALLKLDVQGYELQVLTGCSSLMQSFSCVYVECSFIELYREQALAPEIISFLLAQGFELFGTYNLVHDEARRPVQGDFLFVRPEKREQVLQLK
jgi:FkbM family methyltransferase